MLKPLCGDEHRLYECLRSFCLQDYPLYQIIFGIHDRADPARKVAERLIAEFPQLDIALAVDDAPQGANPKVSNLMQMFRHARHDIIIISDSDVLVRPNCLSAVAAPFADASVGAVTCLYQGAPNPDLASRLGALFINDWFIPSVLVDVFLSGISFCFGAVSAVRREALERAGGLEALMDQLADDYHLGRHIAEAGYQVRLSSHPVDTVVNEKNLMAMLRHEVRWARTVLACRPLDHVLSLVTFPLPVLGAAALFMQSGLLVKITLTVLVLRMGLHLLVQRRFHLRDQSTVWLVPLRECLICLTWAGSFLSRQISWRNKTYHVGEGGRLSRSDQAPAQKEREAVRLPSR